VDAFMPRPVFAEVGPYFIGGEASVGPSAWPVLCQRGRSAVWRCAGFLTGWRGIATVAGVDFEMIGAQIDGGESYEGLIDPVEGELAIVVAAALHQVVGALEDP